MISDAEFSGESISGKLMQILAPFGQYFQFFHQLCNFIKKNQWKSLLKRYYKI